MRRRALQAIMNTISRVFGVYVLWTADTDQYAAACRGVQEAGSPQRVYPWNDEP